MRPPKMRQMSLPSGQDPGGHGMSPGDARPGSCHHGREEVSPGLGGRDNGGSLQGRLQGLWDPMRCGEKGTDLVRRELFQDLGGRENRRNWDGRGRREEPKDDDEGGDDAGEPCKAERYGPPGCRRDVPLRVRWPQPASSPPRRIGQGPFLPRG